MHTTPQANYALMRAAMQMFNKPQTELGEQERTAVMQQVNRELAISKRMLESDAASGVVVPDAAVAKAVQELAGRFDSEEEFERALESNNLDRDSLWQAIAHELKVEAITQQVLGEASEVDEKEAEIYYYQHLERFDLPETRTARHILITINDDYAENTSDAARQRLEQVQQELQQEPGAFKSLAQRHSECPTAMHDGLLGRIKPGQLYPELDAALFEMEEGCTSGVIRTEVGLHILLCEEIHPAQRLSFDEVKEKLREHLAGKKRKRILKEWLQQAA